MKTNKTLSLLAALLAVASLASCGETVRGVCTYNTYTSVSPSNWNELTYQDNNDTQIMSYISGSFFSFDFKFDADGEIVPGQFVVNYDGAEKLEDVTSEYAGEYGVPAEAESQYAYKITLRDTLKWDDGTAITAEDFVYTMKEQLNPAAKHYRADSFYNSGTVIHKARNYVFQGSTVTEDNNVTGAIASTEDLVKGSDGKYTFNGQRAMFAVGAASDWCGGNSLADYAGAGYLNVDKFKVLYAMCDAEGYVAITDESIAALIDVLENSPAWGESAANVPCYIHYDYTYPTQSWDEVGIFVGDNAQELVIVLDKSMQLLNED